jgi:hypothetical protein
MPNMNRPIRIRQRGRDCISFWIFYHKFCFLPTCNDAKWSILIKRWCKNKFFIAQTRHYGFSDCILFFSEAIPAIRCNSSSVKLFFYCFFAASAGRPKKQEKLAFRPAGFSLLSGLNNKIN